MNLKNKIYLGATTLAVGMSSALPAFASGASSPVVSGIQSAVTAVSGDASVVIAAAIGLGATFWGAKVLWGKFKSMAK